MKRHNKKNNGPQNTTQKTKDWGTQILLKTGSELRCSGRVISSFSTIDTSRVTYAPRDKSYSVIYNDERRKKGDIMTTTMAHIRGHLWQRHYIALMVAVRKIFRNLPDCKYLLVGLWYQANLAVSWYGLYKCIEEDVSKLWNLCPIQLYYWTIKFV